MSHHILKDKNPSGSSRSDFKDPTIFDEIDRMCSHCGEIFRGKIEQDKHECIKNLPNKPCTISNDEDLKTLHMHMTKSNTRIDPTICQLIHRWCLKCGETFSGKIAQDKHNCNTNFLDKLKNFFH